MKLLRVVFTVVVLCAPFYAQQTNSDIVPASPGLSVGHKNQRWNVYADTLDANNILVNGSPITTTSCNGGNAMCFTAPNGTACTTANELVEFDSSGNVQTAAASSTRAVGILLSGAGCTGQALVLYAGLGQCVFSNQTAPQDYFAASATPGQCTDVGASQAAGSLGQITSANAGTGTLAQIVYTSSSPGGTGSINNCGTSNGIFFAPAIGTAASCSTATLNSAGDASLRTIVTTSTAQPGIVDFTANGLQDSVPVPTNSVGIEAPAGPITTPYRLQLSELEPPNTNQLLQITANPAAHRWKVGYTQIPYVDVSTMIGTDLGAKINAADAQLGSNPGEIWVTISGTLTTQVSISSGHTLRIFPGSTLTEPVGGGPILIPYTSQNAGIFCDSPSATIVNNQTSYTGANFAGETIKIGSSDNVGPFNKDAATQLTVAGTAGATSITVNNGTGFVAGQDILLKENFAGPYKFAEFNLIASVAGTTINLVYPLEDSYRITGAGTGVYAWSPGHIAKNWFVKGCHITSATGIAANTSGPGIAVYTAIKGIVRDNIIDSLGGRAIIMGASGFPSAYIAVDTNLAENVGQNTVIGSPSIEGYSQSTHLTFTNNIVRGGTSHGFATHGLYKVMTGNQVHGCGNIPGSVGNAGAAGFSHDTGEDLVISNNLADSCTGNGFNIFGSSLDNSTEATRLVISGNIAKDNGGDGFSLGTSGSSGFVRANVEGNFAYRNRGANGGFVFWTSNIQVAFNIVGNWSESNTNYGYSFGNTAAGGNFVSNISINNGNGFNFNSASAMNIGFNTSSGDTTNGYVFGTGDFLKLGFNTMLGGGGGVTGTFGANSEVLGNRLGGGVSQLASAGDNLNFNNNAASGITTLTTVKYATTTNCAAVGTAASPSVAACGASSSGHFSCATNATGATCQVNTTAVTANSEIIVTESDNAQTGTALGVTCNTSTNVLPTSRLLASWVAGSSFTINLGTVTTNPACFAYHIVN